MQGNVITILCLANSRKISGRCVAGREITNNGYKRWIRPISNRSSAELSIDDRRYQNGQDPNLLDIIAIPILEHKPNGFQIENHLINERYYWSFVRRASWEEAISAVDGQGRSLWSNDSSSYNGIHDRVAEAETNPASGSLRLINVTNLEVCVSVEGAEFGNGKRRIRGIFTHLGTQHMLSITDPKIETRFLAGPDGRFNIGRALLCVSLSEPWQGFAYKLIAGVIQPPA